jgi:hypothetical protein
MCLQQQRRVQQQELVQSVVGADTKAFYSADYDSVPDFLHDWRCFLNRLAPNTPHIVGVLDKCVAGWTLRQACPVDSCIAVGGNFVVMHLRLLALLRHVPPVHTPPLGLCVGSTCVSVGRSPALWTSSASGAASVCR